MTDAASSPEPTERPSERPSGQPIEPGEGATAQANGAIVVGVDGSESSIDALRYAAWLARAIRRPLLALAVWNLPPFFYGGYYPVMDWTPEDDATRMLRAASEAVFGGSPPAWFSSGIRQGRPAEVLIEESRFAEMLVLGSRGHGGFAALLLGSVSAACAEHAHCPVLVFHAPVAVPSASSGDRAGDETPV